MFEQTALPLLPGLLDGFNATVFAYGVRLPFLLVWAPAPAARLTPLPAHLPLQATGCGKTHTINGCYDETTAPRTLKDKGVIHLTMDHLFALIEAKKDKLAAQLSFSYLEIYNETIRDLLTDGEGPRNGLALRKDERNRITVPGLTEVQPQGADDIHDAVEAGNKRRRTEMTNANKTSSRSHAVLQINVRVRPLDSGLEENVSVATLSIIDLAGSERAAATSNLGARMKEGSAINKSLLSLGNCINALCQPKTAGRHVPYRDSKLTRLLEFSLGGNCKTCMIVCISPSTVHYDDTQNTLKYANRAKQIKTDVSRNNYSVQTHVKQYVQKIAELSETVAMLQRRLDDKAKEDAGAELRRRDDMRAEVGRAADDVRAKAGQTKDAIVDGARADAVLFATEARLRPIRARLAELAALASSSGGSLAPALAAERDLLARLGQPDEDALASAAIQARVQTAAKSSAVFESVVRAVQERRTGKLDALAQDMVQGAARLATADMEVEQRRAAEQGLRTAARDQADRVAALAGVVARALSAMKDSQGRLDLWEIKGDRSDSAAVKAVSRALGDSARDGTSSLEALLSNAAVRTSSAGRPPSPVKPRSFAATSPPSFPFASSSSAPLPLQPSNALASFAASKSRARRSLAGNNGAAAALASPAKRASAMKSKSAPSPMRSAVAASPYRSAYRASTLSGAGSSSAKKIRWRDEAGEGEIDDASRISGTIDEADEDAEWEDEKADAAPPLPTFKLPSASSSAAVLPSAPSPPPLGSAPTASLQPNVFKVPMLPKAGGKLSRLEEGAERSISSPSASASSSSSVAPPPSLFARKPLGDAPSGLNVNSSFSLSSRMSPDSSFNTSSTKAFSLFAAGPQASPLRQPPVRTQRAVSSPAKRRVSNVGPMRTEKKRAAGRSSLIPVASPPGSAELPLFHEITPKTSALGGGARRVLMADAGAGQAGPMRSPKKAALPTAARGPRPSLMGPIGRSRSSLAPSAPGPVPSYALPTASKTAAVTENLRSRTSISTGGSAAWR